MKIISELEFISKLFYLVNNLNIEKINFVGYTLLPEILYKNASLHIFPTISESFGLVLCETKIFGIPNILVGIDYVSISKGGVSIIFDDSPESIAKEAIKILKNNKYRKRLGIEAKNSMAKFKNQLLIKKWIKLILSIFNGYNYYEALRGEDENMAENLCLNIIKNQINLLKLRNINFRNISINYLKNFTYIEQFYTENLVKNLSTIYS